MFEVRLNGYKNFALYNEIIGTNNYKNIKKIKEWKSRCKEKGMAAIVQWSRIGACGALDPGSTPGRGPKTNSFSDSVHHH